MAAALAIFARAPQAGYSKTRLIPRLGPHGAAQLQAQLIDKTLATATALPDVAVTLWVSGELTHPALTALQSRFAVPLQAQQGADLGARMHAAFVATLGAADRCADRCILIGTDCPALTPAHLQAAFDALNDADAVFVPALDGGYVLIGLRAPQPALFDGISWGSSEVMAQTRQRCASAGLRVHELPALPDLDTPEDYAQAVAQGWIRAVD